MGIEFHPVAHSDLAMLHRWIAQPHWQEWWGNPEEEIAYIRDMVDGRDSTRPFLFSVDGEMAGYIQFWIVADQRIEPWVTMAPWLLDLPDDSVGVDLSIADPDQLGHGLGSCVLRQFVSRLRADGHQTIVIDPDPSNIRAVKAYEKAGFRPVPALLGRTGDILLMQHHPEESAP